MGILFLLLILIYAFFRKKMLGHELFHPEKLLIFTYLIPAISSIILEMNDVYGPEYPANYWSTIYLAAGLFIIISGFRKLDPKNIESFTVNLRFYVLLEIFLIISGFGSIIYFTPFALSAMSGNVSDNRENLEEVMQTLEQFGYVNTFYSAAAGLFIFSILFSFVRLGYGRGSKVNGKTLGIMLLTSSFSYVIYILAYVGRDGVAYWIMSFVFSLIMLPHAFKGTNAIKIFFVVACLFLIVPFAVISISRFGELDDPIYSMFSYLGGQIAANSDYFTINVELTNGALNFRVFYNTFCNIFGCDAANASAEVLRRMRDETLAQEVRPWLFATFVSDLAKDFGLIGNMLILISIHIFTDKICASVMSVRKVKLSQLIALTLLFQVPFWGVFYFKLALMNGYLLVVLALVAAAVVSEKFGQLYEISLKKK